ncbi:MAG: amidohydrolase [Candidatus Abyssobacteria bacterium SURF_17]|uniref:Amidohydrolase n=1 Tax=Candidatus Abyssobacteria bacterium SURF_17 TaxID=2093361 RepID=A0A419F124_9BACT|nr:MAG: amidohydrolase [Candidatus Abyssubacteria bacterium SURF_17]
MGTIVSLIHQEAEKVLSDVIRIRREFHSYPELSFQEFRTSEKIAACLDDLGLEVRRNVATTGVVGLVRGREKGRTIALRADMDALPVEENTGLPFASRNAGVMHACGHDGHMAMLLGAAMVLANLRERIRGSVKFIFQPGEEGYAGARQMIEEGVLDEEPRIEAAFALHLDPLVPSNTLCIRKGPIMACADVFMLSIIGKGGHGALPHKSVDPILVSGHVITALQAVASRQVNPMEAVVLSICTIHAGTAMSIIPERVEMSGTVRLFDAKLRESMPSMMEEIIRGVTAAFGATYDFAYVPGYPATINDGKFTEMVRSVAQEILGPGRIWELERPRMPSEDFSYFLERVPGTFALLGVRPTDREPVPSHNSKYAIDEAGLLAGVKLHAAVALRFLGAEA